MKRADKAKDDYGTISRVYHLVDVVLEGCRNGMTRALQRRELSRVLDVGCGTGTQVVKLRAAGLRAVGIDISAAMLCRARARERAGTSSFVLGDALRLPFPDQAFDALVFSFALHEKPHPQRLAMLAEGRRVLNSGGLVVVLDYVRPNDRRARLAAGFLACIERMAGRVHYRAFRDYMQRGAADGVLTAAGLRLMSRTLWLQGTVGLFEGRWETPSSG
ncbi:class I SAM-dependent methyltransferase [Desulfosoma caldarium]|uniref:Methyltransferase family protein n=1 Tax=Desulfosoma caldarium TaxID=610254 RepID=A0A3N1UFL3_9BACT|nr:methyltransferase domain-containing protein [Desulfosoma caldarium]ROQ90145.1 methyltransferase family protein [Desulfosoma caldarium]